MIVTIIQPYGKWKGGEHPDVTRQFARELIGGGYAVEGGEAELLPGKEKEEAPQPMTVNNYFVSDTPKKSIRKRPNK